MKSDTVSVAMSIMIQRHYSTTNVYLGMMSLHVHETVNVLCPANCHSRAFWLSTSPLLMEYSGCWDSL
jgi:hypothetical protein